MISKTKTNKNILYIIFIIEKTIEVAFPFILR